MKEQEKEFWKVWDKIASHYQSYNHRQMFDFGYMAAVDRIIAWIEDNRSALEIGEDEYIYRDHFNSQSLIAFIKGENK